MYITVSYDCKILFKILFKILYDWRCRRAACPGGWSR